MNKPRAWYIGHVLLVIVSPGRRWRADHRFYVYRRITNIGALHETEVRSQHFLIVLSSILAMVDGGPACTAWTGSSTP
jgi:hypothetical protein